ncbi:MAG: Mur ligase domain-containing protein, partial [Rudaea sp.]
MTPRRRPVQAHVLHSDPVASFRRVHFVGIGGAGMSGIAEVMHNLGYEVSGSDKNASAVTRHLASLGIKIHKKHTAENVARGSVARIDALVVSSAIGKDNPELVAARECRVPVVP